MQAFKKTKKFTVDYIKKLHNQINQSKNHRKHVNCILCSLQYIMNQNVFLISGKWKL